MNICRKRNKRRATSDERLVLITAGPTREYIDPVRYISNDSSGKMGFALARAAVKMGFQTTLVCGPVSIPTPKGVKRINVISAIQMRKEILKRLPKSDIIIMAAAVADWRPLHFVKHKIKRSSYLQPKADLPLADTIHDSRFTIHGLTIQLKPNPDILKELGKKKKSGQILAGFALETDNLEKNARQKLKQKGCDWIIANSAAAIGSDKGSVLMVHKNNERLSLKDMAKDKLAEVMLKKFCANLH